MGLLIGETLHATVLFVLSTGPPQEHLWPLLAHDLGAEDEGGHHAQQSHRERISEYCMEKKKKSIQHPYSDMC